MRNQWTFYKLYSYRSGSLVACPMSLQRSCNNLWHFNAHIWMETAGSCGGTRMMQIIFLKCIAHDSWNINTRSVCLLVRREREWRRAEWTRGVGGGARGEASHLNQWAQSSANVIPRRFQLGARAAQRSAPCAHSTHSVSFCGTDVLRDPSS